MQHPLTLDEGRVERFEHPKVYAKIISTFPGRESTVARGIIYNGRGEKLWNGMDSIRREDVSLTTVT